MENNSRLKIIIASDVDYEHLIAEIYCDDEYIALVQQEEGKDKLKIEFSPTIKVLDVEWVRDAISKAEQQLVGDEYNKSDSTS